MGIGAEGVCHKKLNTACIARKGKLDHKNQREASNFVIRQIACKYLMVNYDIYQH